MPTAGGDEFAHDSFPAYQDPAHETNNTAELYPKNLQDEINEIYHHNKVLPRVAGKDYIND